MAKAIAKAKALAYQALTYRFFFFAFFFAAMSFSFWKFPLKGLTSRAGCLIARRCLHGHATVAQDIAAS